MFLESATVMSRPVWKGHISFGLVNVPVHLYSAERRTSLSFKLIDSRNTARIRYERVNEETGEEVPWDSVVKGFEYEDGNYVLLSDDELKSASVELTRTIEIERFVDIEEIDPIYFDKPYFLVPGKGGEKGYVLLREAMKESGKAGIAHVVIRTRQYLAAMRPDNDAITLNLLRFHQEIRDMADYELPGSDLRKLKVSRKEVELAGKLIEGMAGEWEPEEFHDEYHDAVMKLIQKKIEAGEFRPLEVEEEAEAEEPATINMMDVLKKSVAQASKGKKKRTTKKKSAGSRKRKSSRRAG
jgi:DNA end-binding protein Ku